MSKNVNVTAISAAIDKSKLRKALAAKREEITLLSVERLTIEGMEFEVRPMSVGRRLDLYDQYGGAEGGVSGFLVSLVLFSAFDPETGERVWQDAEMEEVRALPSEIFNPLSQASQRINRTTKDADDAVGNDSETTGPVDSFTESPETPGTSFGT